MHATVRRYPGNTRLVDALLANEEEIRRLLREIPGFRSYHLIRAGDGAVSVSVYDDQAGTEESTRIAGEWIKANLPESMMSAPEVWEGEVVIDA